MTDPNDIPIPHGSSVPPSDPTGPLPDFPTLDMSQMSALDIYQTLPDLSEDDKNRWKMTLGAIVQGVQANNDAKAQIQHVLGTVAAYARTVGLVVTIAKGGTPA